MRGGIAPDKLHYVPLPRLQRDVLAAVLKRYPAPVTTDMLVDQMYQLDPSGGPMNPKINLGVHTHHINKKIMPLGWRIEALGQGRRILTRIEHA